MRVLIGCATSCVALNAFIARGHDAWQCDLLPADEPTNRHIQGDVRDHLADGWDMLIITNPPYCEINARDGHGRWLRHTLSLPGWRYCALLLSWDWPAARANGLGELLDANPFTRCYLMRWKLDFTGEGSPPQRNAWFVWDRDDPRDTTGNHPSFQWMDRADGRQKGLF